MNYNELYTLAAKNHYRLTKGFITFEKYGKQICELIGDIDVLKIDISTSVDLIDTFNQRGNKPSTINRKINTLRGCYKFANKSEPPLFNYKPKFAHLDESKPIPLYFTEEEQEKLLNYFLTIATYSKNLCTKNNNLRMYYGIKIDFKTGFRISNILNLNNDSLYMQKYFMLPDTKNGEPFLLPITQATLDDFINLEKINFFNGWNYHMFYTRYMYAINKLGIDKRKSPHKIRHTFATRASINGADERMLQELGNWKGRECVKRYNHFKDYENKLNLIERI